MSLAAGQKDCTAAATPAGPLAPALLGSPPRPAAPAAPLQARPSSRRPGREAGLYMRCRSKSLPHLRRLRPRSPPYLRVHPRTKRCRPPGPLPRRPARPALRLPARPRRPGPLAGRTRRASPPTRSLRAPGSSRPTLRRFHPRRRNHRSLHPRRPHRRRSACPRRRHHLAPCLPRLPQLPSTIPIRLARGSPRWSRQQRPARPGSRPPGRRRCRSRLRADHPRHRQGPQRQGWAYRSSPRHRVHHHFHRRLNPSRKGTKRQPLAG
jgi:hypothetical protein